MNISIRSLFVILIITVVSNSCEKDNNNAPVLPQKFEWSIDNGTTQSAETITFIRFAVNNYIYATKGSTDIFLFTNTTSPASYSLLNGTGGMGLTISGTQYVNLSCDITISSNSNSLLKGSFTGTFAIINVDTVSMTGTFEDVAYN